MSVCIEGERKFHKVFMDEVENAVTIEFTFL